MEAEAKHTLLAQFREATAAAPWVRRFLNDQMDMTVGAFSSEPYTPESGLRAWASLRNLQDLYLCLERDLGNAQAVNDAEKEDSDA